MRKVATFQFVDVKSVDTEGDGLVKLASSAVIAGDEARKTIEAEVKKHPGALFFRAKAIEADVPNNNGDSFSSEELKKSCDTFVGVPFFTNHNNQNVEDAKGKVVWSEWDDKDNSIYIVAFVDRDAYPNLCRGIEQEYMTGVSMGAVAEDSMILMADMSEKPISDVKPGDKVMTPFGRACTVEEVYNELLLKPMYEFGIKTYHRCPSFTHDHPLMVIDKEVLDSEKYRHHILHSKNKHARKIGKTEEYVSGSGWRNAEYDFVWKHAENVEIGDHILIPSRHSIVESGDMADLELYYLYGAYLGDGYVKFDKCGEAEAVSFCLGMHENDVIARIKECLSAVTKSRCCSTEVEERSGIYISVYDRGLASHFLETFGNGSKRKRVPSISMSTEQAKSLLSGYLDTDGCIVNTKVGNGFGGFQISSVNKSLLTDIQSILISLGYVSRISTMPRTPSENSVVNVDTVENTLAIGSNAKEVFASAVKSGRRDYPDAEIAAGRTFIASINGINYMACPVVDISVVDHGRPVWDLKVSGDESYIADGVAVHNCSVEYSECSVCRNRAATMDDYCVHIRNFKGRKFTGTVKDALTGEIKTLKNHPVYEDNFGIRFIELSGVADPACTSCRIDAIYDNGEICGEKAASTTEPLKADFQQDLLKAAASCYNDFSVLKTAALQKEASEQDIQSLNQCLESLEQVSVKLIQNRANVEMEFASDLVQILANLQDFVDQLVQAGYGQLPEAAGEAVPGTLPEEGAVPAPDLGGAAPQQISAEGDLEIGTTNVEEPLVEPPQAPGLGDFNQTTRPAPSRQTSRVTRPTRPKRKSESEDDMKRRLPNKSAKDRDEARDRLSSDWKEKMDFHSNKLRETLKQDPAISSGGQNMADKKVVEAKSTHSDLHEITEKQLDGADVGANTREEDDREVVTEKQLDSLRKGERNVVTEGQLDGKENLVPRENDGREVITEKQLAGKDPNSRTDKVRETITQDQLEPERVGEQDSITEKQLSNPPVDTPWARSAGSVSKHVEAAIDIVAKATIATSSTPGQVLKSACSISGSVPSDRLAFATEIWNSESDAARISDVVSQKNFWAGKGTKLASSTIREALVAYASEAVKNEGLNPELVIESIHGIRDNDAEYSVEERVDELMASASEETEEEVDVQAEVASYFQTKKAGSEEVEEILEDEKEEDDAEEEEAEDDSEAVEEAEDLVEALSKEETKVADHLIETSLEEMGFEGDVETEAFKKSVVAFARGACASSSIKMAAVVNVTIDDDVVTIAVETDNESVEIPIGDEKEELDMVEEPPELPPMEGEVVDETAPMPEEELPASNAGDDLLGLAKSRKGVKKEAQFGGGDPGVPNAGGGAAPPEDLATSPDVMPEGGGIQTFTEEEVEEDIPGEEDQKMAGSICALCGSDDTETGRKDQMPGQFDCNECGAKYTVHVNIDLLNPEDVVMGAEDGNDLEEPELPEMPVAACVDLSKGVLTKLADSFNSGEASCPACGKTAKVDGEPSSHKIACDTCGTESKRDIIMNVEEPSEAKVKIEWNLKPIKAGCKNCGKVRKAFASDLAFRKMIVAASKSKFPESQAKAWIAEHYGDDAVVSYGPGKGEKLAETVVDQLKTFGLEKVKYMKRLCEVQVKKDPMEECVSHQRKTAGYSKEEAERVCDCLRDKYSTEEDDNIFMEAFANMIDTTILRKMAEHMVVEEEAQETETDDSEMLISEIAVESEEEQVSFDGQENIGSTAAAEEQKMEKEAGEKGTKQTVLEDTVSIPKGEAHMGGEKEAIPEAKSPDVPRSDAHMGHEKETDPGEQEVSIPVELQYLGEEEKIGDKDISTETLGVVASSDEDAKNKPHMSDDKGAEAGKNVKEVESVEGADNVPRGDAKMGHEEPCECKGPEVPRSDAKMGNEGETIPAGESPKVPHQEAEKVETLGNVAAKREEQGRRITQARRDKAVKIAAKMVAQNKIAESEFEEMVNDLVQLPIDRMEYYASKISAAEAPAIKTASTLTAPIVQEDRGIVEADEPKSLAEKLAESFTIGSRQSDRYFKRGEVEDQ